MLDNLVSLVLLIAAIVFMYKYVNSEKVVSNIFISTKPTHVNKSNNIFFQPMTPSTHKPVTTKAITADTRGAGTRYRKGNRTVRV